MALHRLRNLSNCYPEFGDGWSFACIPNTPPIDNLGAHGIAYIVGPETVSARPSPFRLSQASSVEFAFLHLHRLKDGFSISEGALSSDGWQCIFEHSIAQSLSQ